MTETNNKLIATNRKAHYDYFIEETVEAGIILTGTEIKSIRLGRVSLREAYAKIEHGEAWLINAHIAQYPGGNRYNHEPTRTRKLLLHRKELDRLMGKVREKGYTLVPLRLYIKHGYAKIELGLGRGKHVYDKRETIASRDAQREIERAIKVRG
ncbi:MAG: SsrA-binding protein SmpB [Dehalococcoidia bacterium]|nr:SsrA-binding protein SmpB [Dehalococcoidia bacterium]